MLFFRDVEGVRFIKTRSSAGNFKRLRPFLDAVDTLPEGDRYLRFVSNGFMPLSIEALGYSFYGYPVYAMAHYYELNGDLMADPDMTFFVDRKHGHIIPLTFQQDGLPFGSKYSKVFDGETNYRSRLASELDSFLSMWTKNIIDQGFSPAQRAAR